MIRKQQLADERELLAKPGDTITETLEHMKMSQAELATRMGKTASKVNDIISGKEPITYNTALQLEKVLGIDARFWMNLEMQYREALTRLEQLEQLEQYIDWLREHPVKELHRQGYVTSSRVSAEMVDELLKFYGVASPEQWYELYVQDYLNKKITRKVFVSHDSNEKRNTITTWLRMGELEMQKLELPQFDKQEFKQAITSIRNWISHDPGEVLDEVKQTCARAGVAVLFYAPGKLPAKGASRWVAGNPLIQVSLHNTRHRHLFWHTFYHAVGHVMLHGKKQVFIDDYDEYLPDQEKENEADRFADKWVSC